MHCLNLCHYYFTCAPIISYNEGQNTGENLSNFKSKVINQLCLCFITELNLMLLFLQQLLLLSSETSNGKISMADNLKYLYKYMMGEEV